MAIHISTTTPITLQSPRGLLMVNNSTYTGTITVADTTGTLGVITNPLVGASWRAYGFSGTTTITPSTATALDMTLSILNVRE